MVEIQPYYTVLLAIIQGYYNNFIIIPECFSLPPNAFVGGVRDCANSGSPTKTFGDDKKEIPRLYKFTAVFPLTSL